MSNSNAMTYNDADEQLRRAKAALAAAKARKAPRQEIKNLQMNVSTAQAIRNLF